MYNFDRDVLVFDLETTGLDLQKDETVQFCAVRWAKKNNQIKKVKELSFICKPSVSIHPEAAAVHGITNEMVSGKKPFSEYISDIEQIFLGVDVAGYNILGFDVHILNRQMEENGLQGFLDSFYFYDAYKVYTEDFPRDLKNAYKQYTDKELQNAHNAIADVEATSEVIFEQLKLRDQSLRAISEAHIAPPSHRVGLTNHIVKLDDKFIINFGNKWNGSPIEKVDKGYLRWILNTDFPRAVKEFVSKFV